MKIIIFIPSFIFFLFTLYKLVKEDHVFLRKNIKNEQVFDIVFIATIVGLILAQFASTKDSLSIPQVVIGGGLILFLIGKYRKFPLGRLFDFSALSFLNSLPIAFLMLGLFFKKNEIIVHLFQAFIYLLLTLFFTRRLLPRIMSRTFKEGNLSIYIFILFSSFSLLISIFNLIKGQMFFWNSENVSLLVIITISIALLVKQSLFRAK